MARFVFSLETVLRHREDLEQKERDELMRRNYRLNSELHHRDDLGAKLQQMMNQLSMKQAGQVDSQELRLFQLYSDRLTHEIGESEKRLVELETQVRMQKDAVIEAAKKKSVIASLKDKKKTEFVTELEKQEQKDIDDLVVTRFNAR